MSVAQNIEIGPSSASFRAPAHVASSGMPAYDLAPGRYAFIEANTLKGP